MATKDKLVNLEDLKVVGDAVGGLKTATDNIGANLLDYYDFASDVYNTLIAGYPDINGSGGIISSATWLCSDYIPFEYADTVFCDHVNGSSFQIIRAYYDENKGFLNGAVISYTGHGEFTNYTNNIKFVKVAYTAVNKGLVKITYKHNGIETINNTLTLLKNNTGTIYITEKDFEDGGLSSTGLDEVNAKSLRSANHIAVTPGMTYTISTIHSNNTLNYIINVSYYTNNSSSTQRTGHSDDGAKKLTFTAPDNCTFVRITLRNSDNTNAAIWQLVSVAIAYSRPLSGFISQDKRSELVLQDSLNATDYAFKYGWSVGLLGSSGTVDATNTGYITTDFIPINTGDRINIITPVKDGSYYCARCVYDANKDFLRFDQFTQSFGTPAGYTAILNAAYIRFCVQSATQDGLAIVLAASTPSMLDLEAQQPSAHAYTGTAIDMSIPNGYSIKKMFPYTTVEVYDASGNPKTGQGFAVYGDYLFQFFDGGYCRVYNMNTAQLINSFSIAVGHANQVSFSDTFYDSGDTFPLLYVTDANGVIYVCRITTLSGSIVKTLALGSAFGVSANLCIDQSNTGIGYSIALKNYDIYADSDNPYVIKKVDLTDLTDNGDDTYTPAVLDTFEITPSTRSILQQSACVNGKLFIPRGIYSASNNSLTVVDLTSKTISNTLDDIPAALKNIELEGVCVTPNRNGTNYDLIIYLRGNNYYRIQFA